MTDTNDPSRPSRAEFRREVLGALRAAGLEGPFEREGDGDRLVHAGEGAFDLREAYDTFAGLEPKQRAEAIERLARGFVDAPKIPMTWDEAKDVVMPALKPRIALTADEVRVQRGSTVSAAQSAEVTAHLVFQVVLPQTKLRQGIVSTELIQRWGVPPDTVFHTALENLKRASDLGWGLMPEAPGVYFSPWKDGYDASRILLPRLFAGVPLKGRAVALAASPSALAFTGSEDEEGLFHLARLCRRLWDQSHTYLFFRPIRMGEDGASWEDWMPPKGHGAYEALRRLQAINEVGDYGLHGEIVRRAAEGKGTPMPLPNLEIVEHRLGDETMTITRWKEGPWRALPKADAVVFERGEETLGIAPWAHVAKTMRIKPTPGYPTRYLASDFPEDWQLGMLHLEPWGA